LYAELSWPQIAALPRDVPLLIPLGLDDEECRRLARSFPQDTVLLPAVPYGFAAPDDEVSGPLKLPRALMRRVLRAIRRSLAAQGFAQVRFMDPCGVEAQLAPSALTFTPVTTRRSDHFEWPSDLADRVVLVSTGHTEQHGHHLPSGVDTMIAEAIAAGVAAQAPQQVVCLPTWPYGASTHVREFPATLNLGGRLLEDLFVEVVGSLVRQGARRILFSNAHGGNHSYLVNVVKAAGEHWPQAFTALEFLHTTGPALERYRQTGRGGMGHGGELETSYLLHLRPDLVDMRQATTETDFIATPNYYMDWIEGGRLIANPPWSDDTQTGIYGDATLATAEKGRLWLQAAVSEKLESIAEVQEQQRRRTERRTAR
jgi:creatinine amidohydrolase